MSITQVLHAQNEKSLCDKIPRENNIDSREDVHFQHLSSCIL